MIRLIHLLEDRERDYINKSKTPHSVWQTAEKKWGATDEWGITRYYETREEAWQFANNKGKESPHPGRPIPHKRRSAVQDKQRDDRADMDIDVRVRKRT